MAAVVGLSGVFVAEPPPPTLVRTPTTQPRIPPTGIGECTRWVAEAGNNDSQGTEDDPWATIAHAFDTVPDSGCTIMVMPGTYRGAQVERRFQTTTTLRSAIPQAAVLRDRRSLFDFEGATNIVVTGFEITNEGPGSRGVLVNIEDDGDLESEWIEIRDNIIHDSYEDDLLKIRSGARHVLVKGNVFYNQAPSEQHIDVNGVQDVVIEDNIFSNDFAASGRQGNGDEKAFIVVKDSSGTGELGSRRVTIHRNVFMNYEGGPEPLLQIGNDGKGYHEAIDVLIENNLLIGNTDHEVLGALGISGVKDVAFVNNTVVGDLPGTAYGVRLTQKRDNLPNSGILIANNLYADSTGTMGRFSRGVEGGAAVVSNLYWNGGAPLSEDGPITPSDDPTAVRLDPEIETDHSGVRATLWNGTAFSSGETEIRAEFLRIVSRYATLSTESGAIEAADPAFAPTHDILGQRRGPLPDIGAMQR